MRMQLLVTTLAMSIASATARGQSVTYDYDKGTDFSKIRTYAWTHTPAELADEINHKRVVSAIDSQLAAKGLTKVEPGGMADVLVAYGAGVDRNLQITGSSSDFGGPLYRGNRFGSARTEDVLTGTLVIAMVDPETKSIVWRGAASKDLDPKAKPEKREKNLNKAVKKMFDNYPPKKG
jgi:hypothetical protein